MKHSDVIKKLKAVPCSPDADDIPNGPGVYWYSRGGKILYIGDSTKLKDRIKQEAAVPFTYESSDAVPSNLASTNLRLRRLIHEERESAKKEGETVELHYIQSKGTEITVCENTEITVCEGAKIPVCEILYDCKCNSVKCEKNCLNWEEDCIYFNLKDKGLIYKTSLSKLARVAPKQTLAVIQAWNGTPQEEATMSLERVLLMSYWLEFKHLPHWNLTF